MGMNRKYLDRYKKLGLNIAYYRNSQDITQEKLADALGSDRTTISKIEQARAGVSLDYLFAIADYLKIPVSKLLEFRD